MSEDGISIRVEGDKEFLRALDKVKSPARRVSMLEQIGAYGVSSTQQRFIAQAGPDGTPWKKSRRAESLSGQTLRDSNRLFSSFNFSAGKDAVEWGTNLPYAGIHQFGGEINAKNGKALAFKGFGGGLILVQKVTMPKREFLGINDRDTARMTSIVQNWMKGAFA